MEYIYRNSLLYKTGVEYGDFTINHVLGCAHGCLFPCYAFNMAKRFGKAKTYEDWIKPKLVINSLELLDKEIPKYINDIKSVHLCFTTDPFMVGYPDVIDMTLKIIKRLNKDNIKVTTLTKGIIPQEAIETAKYNEYGITLVSLNESFKEEYEIGCSDYNKRIDSLKMMHDYGFKTWVSIEPYPTPNVCKQDLISILNKVSFVDHIVFGRWHYNKRISEYKNYKVFYQECVEIVKQYCSEKNITYHIKKGTII